jgi:pantothenate synthetase
MSTRPIYTPSQQLISITDKINQYEQFVRLAFSGNDDWRAKLSYNTQLATMRKQYRQVEEQSLNEYRRVVAAWEEEQRRIEQVNKQFEENPILAMDIREIKDSNNTEESEALFEENQILAMDV